MIATIKSATSCGKFSLILLIVFALYPLIDTFIISFLKDYNYINGKNNGLTLDNYKVLFQIIPPPSHIPGLSAPISAFFTSALPNTLLITFVTVPVSNSSKGSIKNFG